MTRLAHAPRSFLVSCSPADGLYMASATAEGNGSWIDIEAGSALTAVKLAEFERGQLCRRGG